MNYLSLCSGIEAATLAWKPLGWNAVAFSEIDTFASAVLAHHYPQTPNLGDMNEYKKWNIQEKIQVMCGGTPCQSFSVAGLRQGLQDPRGNLMLTYLAIAEHLRPEWLVWENVPGVLSSNGGKDFGTFLGALGYLGYEDWAYRILDAQWFGVPQRRKRVFVVANLGNGKRATKVLFDGESLRRNFTKSEETKQRIASSTERGIVEDCRVWDKQRIGQYANNDVSSTVAARDYKDATDLISFTSSSHANYREGVGTLRAHGGDLGGGSENLVIPIHDMATRHAGKNGNKSAGKGNGLGVGKPGDPCPTLTKGDRHAVLYENHGTDSRVTGPLDLAPSCVARYGTGGCNLPFVQTKSCVRRLTVRECERLQGFPDDFTQIPWRNKSADKCPDGKRYKSIGNSMAVPCMAWVGRRIEKYKNS